MHSINKGRRIFYLCWNLPKNIKKKKITSNVRRTTSFRVREFLVLKKLPNINNYILKQLKNIFVLNYYTSTRQMSEPGISNCASNNSFSRIDLRPLAPVFFLIASLEIIFKASGVKCNSTGFPSTYKWETILIYCQVRPEARAAWLGECDFPIFVCWLALVIKFGGVFPCPRKKGGKFK